MANITVSEVDATRQALVASIVQETLKAKAVLLPCITDYSSMVQPGEKSISIARRNQFTAADKVANTGLTSQIMTFSADTINLNKHKAIYSTLEKIAGLQAGVNVAGEILKESANELALQVDKDIIVALKAVSSTTPDHIVALTANIQTDILNARMLLNLQKVPMNERFIAVSPKLEKSLLSVADFVRADAYGNSNGLQLGELGKIYGMTVLQHTELGDDEMLVWHKSLVAFAQQQAPQYMTDMLLKDVVQEFLLDHVYGLVTLNGGKAGVYYNATGA